MVAVLLSHYWTANDDPAIRHLQAADWLHDLEEFPLGAIEIALGTWRLNQTRRPTPADIRKQILPEAVALPPPTVTHGYAPFPQPKLTSEQRRKLRHAQLPFWALLRRVQRGEMTADQMIAERKRLTAEMYERDPELRIINKLVGP
jgi:hypothetical protein